MSDPAPLCLALREGNVWIGAFQGGEGSRVSECVVRLSLSCFYLKKKKKREGHETGSEQLLL